MQCDLILPKKWLILCKAKVHGETRQIGSFQNKVKKQVHGYRMNMWRKHNLIRLRSELLRVIKMYPYICRSFDENESL